MSNPNRFRLIDLFCDALFLLPVLLTPIVFTSFNTNTIVMKEPILQFSTAYLLGAWVVLQGFRKLRDPTDSVGTIIPATRFIIAIALLWIYLYLITPSHPRTTHELTRWSTYLLLAVVSSRFAADPRRFRLYLYGTIVSGTMVNVYAVLQACNIDFFPWGNFAWEETNVKRVVSSLGNPDYLAGYLVALLPLTFTLVLIQKGRWRFLLLGILLLQGIAMLFTYSRGGWVATFITLTLLIASLIYINWIKDPPLFRPILSLRAAGGLLVLVVLCGIFLAWLKRNEVSAALFRFSQMSEGVSVATRPYFYRGALAMFAAKPFFGFGLGTFALHFPEFRPKGLAVYLPFKEHYVEHVHNEFLEILSETGLIGLTLYGTVLLVGMRMVWSAVTRFRSRENVVLLGLWSGILGLLLHNMFTVTLRYPPSAFLLWSFLGVSVGYARKISMTESVDQKWIRRIAPILFLICIPFLVTAATRHYLGDCLISSGSLQLNQINSDDSLSKIRQHFEKALVALHQGERLAPEINQGYYRLGLAYFKLLDYPQAKEIYLRLDRLQKNFTSTPKNLCVTSLKQRDMIGIPRYLPPGRGMFPLLGLECAEDGLYWIKQALADDPDDPEYYNLMGLCYFALDRLDEAERAFRAAIAHVPHRPIQDREEILNDSQTHLKLIAQLRTAIAAQPVVPDSIHPTSGEAIPSRRPGALPTPTPY